VPEDLVAIEVRVVAPVAPVGIPGVFHVSGATTAGAVVAKLGHQGDVVEQCLGLPGSAPLDLGLLGLGSLAFGLDLTELLTEQLELLLKVFVRELGELVEFLFDVHFCLLSMRYSLPSSIRVMLWMMPLYFLPLSLQMRPIRVKQSTSLMSSGRE